jgi:ATP-dependent RNA helicase RhlE
VTPVSSTAETIQQELYYVDSANKKDLLIHLLKDKSIETALVFTRTKHGADKIMRILLKANIKAEAIHGNKSQNARQNALKNFKERTTRVLVATDIAARGIDIDELNLVINYDIPNIAETYVHRIGRTGRAGLDGKAISFCDIEEAEYIRDIQKLISIQIPVVKDHPYPAVNIAAVKTVAKSKTKSRTPSGAKDKGRPGQHKHSSTQRMSNTEDNSARKILLRKDK